MSNQPPDPIFDPDDPNIDPWADDPNAPKEPGWNEDSDSDWESEDDAELPAFDSVYVDEASAPSPPPGILGPAALLDSQVRGEIEFEILYQSTLAEAGRVAPQPDVGPQVVRVLALGVLFFALLATWQFGWRWSLEFLLVGTAVFAVHELGHWLAMIGTGVFVPRAFLLPILRRSFLETRFPAIPWKPAAVHLAGPIFGLAIAGCIQFSLAPPPGTTLFLAVAISLVLNAYLLLPLAMADGGRFLEWTLLSRQPWTGTVLRAMIVSILVGVMVFVGKLSLVLALGFPCGLLIHDSILMHAAARSRRILGRVFPTLSPDWQRVPSQSKRQLFEIALALRPKKYTPKHLATVVRDLHEQASHSCTALRGTAVLLAIYGLAWLLFAATLAHLALA